MFAGFLNTLVLLGALQGFIICGVLLASARKRPAERTSRRLLALLVLLIALACLEIYLNHTAFWTSTLTGVIISTLLPLIVVMPVGPLIYFYARSCVEPELRLDRRDRRHFYTAVVDLFPHVAALLFLLGLISGLFTQKTPFATHFGSWLDDYNQYADIPRWLSLTIYLWLTTKYLRRRKLAGSESNAAVRAEHDRWPGNFLRVFWAFDVFWLLHLIPYELPRIGDELIARFDWYPLYLPLVAIIYYLGVKGYFISYPKQRSSEAAEIGKGSAVLSEEKVGPLILVLKKSMEEERLWLNADLNLGRLAQHCGTAPKLLSTVLNQHMDITFNEFVNGYRIDAVKERMQRPDSRKLTIAGLAYECGFNSLPTFQRAFKATTGMSPREYIAGQTLTLPE